MGSIVYAAVTSLTELVATVTEDLGAELPDFVAIKYQLADALHRTLDRVKGPWHD